MSRKPISTRQRFSILHRDGFRCRYCGKTAGASDLHVDHVHPVAKGGTNKPSNLVTACRDCNLGKHTKVLKTPPSRNAAIRCDRCGDRIHKPNKAQAIYGNDWWRVIHDDCLNDVENPYWISLDELMDVRSASRWQFHLGRKQGYDPDAWSALMQRVSEGMAVAYG